MGSAVLDGEVADEGVSGEDDFLGEEEGELFVVHGSNYYYEFIIINMSPVMSIFWKWGSGGNGASQLRDLKTV